MTLLWSQENWSLYVSELEAPTCDIKEAPLRRDVRSLGMLLGQVLREQAGDVLFSEEEELRQLAIRRREVQKAPAANTQTANRQGETGEAEDQHLFREALERVQALDPIEAY